MLRKFYLLPHFWLNLRKMKVQSVIFATNSCNKCDICKNYLTSGNKFKCKVTRRVYSVRSSFTCNSPDVVYINSFKNGGDQYVGSTTDFKA